MDDGAPRRARAGGRAGGARARPARSATSRTPSTRTARRASALANSNGFCGVVRADAVLRVRLRVRRRGRGPHDRHRASAVARGPGRRSTPRRSAHEAADRALALHGARQPTQPPLPGRARPLRRGELRLGDRPDAVGRRGPARPLAVRRQGGRADRRSRAAAGRRRPRPGGPRDRAVRRRGRSAAAHRADRGRRRCAPTCSTAYTARKARARVDRQRRRAAPTGRRRRSDHEPAGRPRASATHRRS